MRCFLFYLYFGVIARRHVKEINRGMRPPRRIFTRSRGEREAALVKHFLIKSKSIACLRAGERSKTCGEKNREGCERFSRSSFYSVRFDIYSEISLADGDCVC